MSVDLTVHSKHDAPFRCDLRLTWVARSIDDGKECIQKIL